jgi:hypothetical protein
MEEVFHAIFSNYDFHASSWLRLVLSFSFHAYTRFLIHSTRRRRPATNFVSSYKSRSGRTPYGNKRVARVKICRHHNSQQRDAKRAVRKQESLLLSLCLLCECARPLCGEKSGRAFACLSLALPRTQHTNTHLTLDLNRSDCGLGATFLLAAFSRRRFFTFDLNLSER